MTLYLVYGNANYEGCRHISDIFGIYSDRAKAEAARIRIINQLEQEIFNPFSVGDIEVKITEVEADILEREMKE